MPTVFHRNINLSGVVGIIVSFYDACHAELPYTIQQQVSPWMDDGGYICPNGRRNQYYFCR